MMWVSDNNVVTVYYHTEIDAYELQFKDVDEVIGLDHGEVLDVVNCIMNAMSQRNLIKKQGAKPTT